MIQGESSHHTKWYRVSHLTSKPRLYPKVSFGIDSGINCEDGLNLDVVWGDISLVDSHCWGHSLFEHYRSSLITWISLMNLITGLISSQLRDLIVRVKRHFFLLNDCDQRWRRYCIKLHCLWSNCYKSAQHKAQRQLTQTLFVFAKSHTFMIELYTKHEKRFPKPDQGLYRRSGLTQWQTKSCSEHKYCTNFSTHRLH